MNHSELRANLLKLMTEHPDLPVVAMTDSEVVSDKSAWYFSSIGYSGIVKVACWQKPNGETGWYDDINMLVEDMMDYFADDDDMAVLSNDQYESFIRVKAENFDWREVIYVNIVPFDPQDIA